MEFVEYQSIANPGIEVLAVQLTKDNVSDVAELTDGVQIQESNPFDIDQTFVGVNVPTRAGKKRASEGDFVVQVGPSEYVVQKAGLFSNLYRPKQ